ncbi:transcription regulator [Dendrothele bispora CBS 962.96]|uniref:Transcription regulator n=1 Tax=Dendrothele bispora (strain CBS 962.96) TaxID=1314807 RepID=A0A4S8MY38_DENBC|nr:transcription regulator [Dendrothele bispora CBS 962.96]
MGLFKRKGSDDGEKKEKGAWRRPANTAFKQQRLKAWQPILTPKTVLPTFFIVAIIFGPIGGLLIWGSSQVSEMRFDYTDCENLQPSPNGTTLNFVDLPSDKYSYRLSRSISNIQTPQYALVTNENLTNGLSVSDRLQCVLNFTVPIDLDPPVFLYYGLTNFYQNHRRYVKSLDSDQLRGRGGSADTLNKGDCDPLGSLNGKPIYPCGLIANSVFNDTFSTPQLLNTNTQNPESSYVFSEKNIAWPGESKKYVSTPIENGYDSFEEIVPPPNWALRYPSYNESNFPNLAEDEHFQNWMRTAGLPTFTKLWGRNDTATMAQGRYQIIIGMNYPVQPYKGTKSVVISTVSWIGGKNPFLGWAYVAAAGLFAFLAIVGTIRHLVKPRRLGDMSLLSWNR